MSINQLLAKITKNWPVKAICFVLAAMIYFFHQISLLDVKTFSVPLEVRAEGNMIPVSGLEQVKYIRVKVRTKRDQIASIMEKDLTAFIDVSSQTKEGIYDFPVYVDLDEKIVQLDLEPLEIYNQPDNVKIQIQKKTTKAVPLYASVLGKPAHGYKALSAELEPSFVTLCGPASMLDSINKMPVGAVSVEGAEGSISKIVSPVNTNSYISILGEKNSIRVSVPIVIEGTAKEFKNVAEITGIILTKLDGTAKGGVAVAGPQTAAVHVNIGTHAPAQYTVAAVRQHPGAVQRLCRRKKGRICSLLLRAKIPEVFSTQGGDALRAE